MQLAIVARQLGRPCSAQALEDDWHALQFQPCDAAVWMHAAGGSLLQFAWCWQEVLQLAHVVYLVQFGQLMVAVKRKIVWSTLSLG